jgi:uncharacterized membrane protein (UPF0127 family)
MRRHLPYAGAIALAVLCALSVPVIGKAPSSATSQPSEMERVRLTIDTAGGTQRFTVEVARSDAEQARGLMFRTVVAKGTGMLFPMTPPREASFWMKNTLIPLDMIFIRPNGTIARIAERTTPESLALVDSGEPVSAVLELAGGAAAAQGIAAGDRVRWPGGPTG